MFDDVVVKDLNISDGGLSNDMIDVVRTNDSMFLFIPRSLYSEIVTLFRLMLFVTCYLYNKFI